MTCLANTSFDMKSSEMTSLITSSRGFNPFTVTVLRALVTTLVLVTVTRRVTLGAQQQFFALEYFFPATHVSAKIHLVAMGVFVVLLVVLLVVALLVVVVLVLVIAATENVTLRGT
jgi:hypothetical protein